MANSKILDTKPKERLYNVMELTLEKNLARLELPMSAAAEKDSVAWEIVSRVYQRRLDLIRMTLSEMGFEGEGLEMRTYLFVCYHTWERVMFRNLIQAKHLHSLIHPELTDSGST